MARKLTPVTIWGIEFDALVDENKTLTSNIPSYPVEDGFPVSDTIINEPVTVQLTLYVSNTPVTWLYRHGSSMDRVKKICDRIESKWHEKKLTKIVTTDTIYTDMGLLSISIKHSKEIGYAREITISAKKVRKTARKTALIPTYVLQSGETMANAGAASTSTTSSKSNSGGSNSGNNSSGSSSSSNSSSAKKNQSILYGAANGLGLI